MKAKNVQYIIFLGIFFLFASQVWAEDWLYYDTALVGDRYYDKSRINEVSKGIISVWTKIILSENAKTKYFSILKSINQAPANPSQLNYYEELLEIDFTNRKIRNVAVSFYGEKGNVIYSSAKGEFGQWNAIEPNSVGEKLSNMVSWESVLPKETVAATGVEKSVTPQKGDVGASTVISKNLTEDKSDQNKTKAIPKEDDRNIGTKKIISREPGDVGAYRKPVVRDVVDQKSKLSVNRPAVTTANREIATDGRFIAYNNQTVLDTRTNLIWAAKDNGQDINWYGAKKYCEKYRGGGYTDWRMPTPDELAGLYDKNKTQRNKTADHLLHLTELINLTSCCPWSSETRDSEAAYFDFTDGSRWWFLTPGTRINRALPVRTSK